MFATLAYNATTAKLVGGSREMLLEAQRVLSYRVDGYEHMAAFKNGGWDGRASFLDYAAATFPAGFVHLVHAALIRARFEIRLVRKPLPEPLGPAKPRVDHFPEDSRYQFQWDVADSLIRHGQMIARVATGGGKSRIAKICTMRIGRPTLFLTTRAILMHQMRVHFLDVTKRVGVLGDGMWAPCPSGVNVGMVQTIIERLKEPGPDASVEQVKEMARRMEEMLKLLSGFELVILEEAHESAGNSFFDIMNRCRNAQYRLALTATPFMKDSEESNMRLMGVSGPVAVNITEKQLIDCGILATPKFKYITGKPVPKLYRSTPWPRAYKLGIVENRLRNLDICREAIRAAYYGLSVMILVIQKAHGEALQTMLRSVNIRCDYINGDANQVERLAALKRLGKKQTQVLIGSTILDVGVDVPSVGMIILAGAGKAQVGNRQRIGRGLREKKDGSPNVALIVDFMDVGNTHLEQHSKQRRAFVDETPGFAENVVNEFDYKALGYLKAA